MSAQPLFADFPQLNGQDWRVSYRHEDGDLVELFYIPALACSVQYDRMTGYFSASALALAARGVDRLISSGGRMRLVVGCTLEEPESAAMAAGYNLRDRMETQLASVSFDTPDSNTRQGLAKLASLIARGNLDVKVAVPVDPQGRPVSGNGIYHEKVGILSDVAGNQLAFSGSINETAAGWRLNRESFQVFCSWFGGRELEHVQSEAKAFARLWEDRCSSVRVFDFPAAARAKLLEFLPKSDRPVTPIVSAGQIEPRPPEPALSADEKRRIVWSYIRHSAALPGGLCVGHATAGLSPWPHQLANFVKFIENWPARLLIADEVGLGKTITAGLILRQAWLSGLARRILILAPAGLLIQWQNELYEKFNLNVPIYTGKQLVWRKLPFAAEPKQLAASQQDWPRQPFVLASSHLVRRKERQAELLTAPHWDLIVLDEAHHARRTGGVQNAYRPNTLLTLLSELQPKTASLLLLTATPMQVHPVEIWDLLQLLGLPEKWNSSAAFLRYFEQVAHPNPSASEFEFLAEMFRITERTYGPIAPEHARRLLPPSVSHVISHRILKALREDKASLQRRRLSADERKLALQVMQRVTPLRYLMARQTRHLLREYYRQGKLTSPIATRDPQDIAIDLSPQERALYEAVENYISQTYDKASLTARSAVGFVMTIYRRRLASSFFALQKTLVNRLNRVAPGEEDLSLDELHDTADLEEAAKLADHALAFEETVEIKALLKRIAQLPTDSKAVRLLKELQIAFEIGYDSAIVFTQFYDTMDYLKGFIADCLPGKKIACYSGEGGLRRNGGGNWTRCRKEDIKRDLKAKKIEILLCTDAAGEGLNLQFCGVLVNYDLPWNPMKVEQRIGRIDRIGQLHERIRIYNLAYQDTVEADVYFTVGQRINLFQGIVGKLQPILSRLPKKFEECTLGKASERGEARERLMADIEGLEHEALNGGFDIDVASPDTIDSPRLSPAPLSLADLSALAQRKELLPPVLSWRSLDADSCAASLPGMESEIRTTTDGAVFADCSDSQVLFSLGGELFEDVADLAAPAAEDRSRSGVCWLAKNLGEPNFLLATRTGLQSIASFPQLMEMLESVSTPQELSSEIEIVERIV